MRPRRQPLTRHRSLSHIPHARLRGLEVWAHNGTGGSSSLGGGGGTHQMQSACSSRSSSPMSSTRASYSTYSAGSVGGMTAHSIQSNHSSHSSLDGIFDPDLLLDVRRQVKQLGWPHARERDAVGGDPQRLPCFQRPFLLRCCRRGRRWQGGVAGTT